MVENPKRGRPGSKLARTETVQVRLDPFIHYAAQLAAAKERRTMSSFIEWAVKTAVYEVIVAMDDQGADLTAAALATQVWDVYEADTFVNLARQHRTLLTHDDMRKWKFITETREFWLGADGAEPEPNKPALRLAWDLITDHLREETPFDWREFASRVEKSRIKVEWSDLLLPSSTANPSLPAN